MGKNECKKLMNVRMNGLKLKDSMTFENENDIITYKECVKMYAIHSKTVTRKNINRELRTKVKNNMHQLNTNPLPQPTTNSLQVNNMCQLGNCHLQQPSNNRLHANGVPQSRVSPLMREKVYNGNCNSRANSPKMNYTMEKNDSGFYSPTQAYLGKINVNKVKENMNDSTISTMTGKQATDTTHDVCRSNFDAVNNMNDMTDYHEWESLPFTYTDTCKQKNNSKTKANVVVKPMLSLSHPDANILDATVFDDVDDVDDVDVTRELYTIRNMTLSGTCGRVDVRDRDMAPCAEANTMNVVGTGGEGDGSGRLARQQEHTLFTLASTSGI